MICCLLFNISFIDMYRVNFVSDCTVLQESAVANCDDYNCKSFFFMMQVLSTPDFQKCKAAEEIQEGECFLGYYICKAKR